MPGIAGKGWHDLADQALRPPRGQTHSLVCFPQYFIASKCSSFAIDSTSVKKDE
jgi:hypothetical protein